MVSAVRAWLFLYAKLIYVNSAWACIQILHRKFIGVHRLGHAKIVQMLAKIVHETLLQACERKVFQGGSSKEEVVSRKEEGGSSKEEVVLRQFGIVSMAYGICHHNAGVTCETVSVKCKIFSPNFNIVSGFAHQQLPMRLQIIHSRAS